MTIRSFNDAWTDTQTLYVNSLKTLCVNIWPHRMYASIACQAMWPDLAAQGCYVCSNDWIFNVLLLRLIKVCHWQNVFPGPMCPPIHHFLFKLFNIQLLHLKFQQKLIDTIIKPTAAKVSTESLKSSLVWNFIKDKYWELCLLCCCFWLHKIWF